jgi:hypothetical protein
MIAIINIAYSRIFTDISLKKRYDVIISSMNLLILHPNYETYQMLKLPRLDKEVNYIFEMVKILK